MENNSNLIIEINKGIFTTFIENQPECQLCYEILDVNECLVDLKSGEYFNNKNSNFMIADLLDIFGNEGAKKIKNIVNILWIRTDKINRHKGLATNLMRKFLDLYADAEDTIVVFRVTATKDDYPTEPTDSDYAKLFMNMEKFLAPLGFHFHKLQYICGLEFSMPYIYLSPNSPAAKYAWDIIINHCYCETNSWGGLKYGYTM